METVILVIHLMIVLALIVVVLLQRSEGGGLGMGGGGNFMSSRGAGNALTRATSILAGAFFVTSIVLAILATQARAPRSILDQRPAAPAPAAGQPAVPAPPATPQVPASGAPGTGTGILDQLRQMSPSGGTPQPPAAPPQ